MIITGRCKCGSQAEVKCTCCGQLLCKHCFNLGLYLSTYSMQCNRCDVPA